MEVAAVASAFSGLTIPWAIAGGWAIDFALRRITRPHHDVDVTVFRGDQARLRSELGEWTFEVVRDGVRVSWPVGLRLDAPLFETYAWPMDADPASAVEILLDDRIGDDWVYRRDPTVRRPVTRAIRSSAGGIPLLAPEIVLLYKSREPRREDEHDFAVALELLDGEARVWLRSAIARTHTSHPWITRLADGERPSTPIPPGR